MNTNEILDSAETIASSKSPDEAARFLAPFRKQSCEKLHEDPSQIATLLQIVTAQLKFLNAARAFDKSSGIAEWFLHILHHLQEDMPDLEWNRTKFVLRDSFSAFFRHYAKSLAQLDRIEDMRIAMRNAIDLTSMIPMAIVFAVHLYLPLTNRETIENQPSKRWFLDRCAEFLAALDFSGLHNTPFREALDGFQITFRDSQQSSKQYEHIQQLAHTASDDIALETIKNIFKNQFISN